MMINIFQSLQETFWNWFIVFFCFVILRYFVNYQKITLFKQRNLRNYIIEMGSFLLASISSGIICYFLYMNYLGKITASKLFIYYILLFISIVIYIISLWLFIKTTNAFKLIKNELSLIEKSWILAFLFFMSLSFIPTVGLFGVEVISILLFKLPFVLSPLSFKMLLEEVTVFLVCITVLLFIDSLIAEEGKSPVKTMMALIKKK